MCSLSFKSQVSKRNLLAKTGLQSIVVNKVLLELNHTHLFIYVYECFHATREECLQKYSDTIWPEKP